LTDELIRKGLKIEDRAKQEEVDKDTKYDDDRDDDPYHHPRNKSKLLLNATVCDADITDLDLLNESRQKS